MPEAETIIKINPAVTQGRTEQKKPLSELTTDDLTPGTKLSGLPGFNELDAFLEKAVIVLGDQNQSDKNTHAFFFRNERLSSVGDNLIEQVRRKRFFGVLKNFTVIMLLPEMIPNVPKVRKGIGDNESMAFILDAEMHSTGRGRIGNARRLCGLYISQSEPIKVVIPSAPEASFAREILATSRIFEPAGFQSDIDRLLEDSRRGERMHTLEALKRTVFAGAFELGKR
jgi:hypothetical protein